MKQGVVIGILVFMVFLSMIAWGQIVKQQAIDAAVEAVEQMERPYAPGIRALNLQDD